MAPRRRGDVQPRAATAGHGLAPHGNSSAKRGDAVAGRCSEVRSNGDAKHRTVGHGKAKAWQCAPARGGARAEKGAAARRQGGAEHRAARAKQGNA